MTGSKQHATRSRCKTNMPVHAQAAQTELGQRVGDEAAAALQGSVKRPGASRCGPAGPPCVACCVCGARGFSTAHAPLLLCLWRTRLFNRTCPLVAVFVAPAAFQLHMPSWLLPGHTRLCLVSHSEPSPLRPAPNSSLAGGCCPLICLAGYHLCT